MIIHHKSRQHINEGQHANNAAFRAGLPEGIAVASDDGCLRLFGIEDGEPGLAYQCALPHLEGRLLSAAWHPKGRVIVVGTSVGTLHALETSSKREVLRIQTGQSQPLPEALSYSQLTTLY